MTWLILQSGCQYNAVALSQWVSRYVNRATKISNNVVAVICASAFLRHRCTTLVQRTVPSVVFEKIATIVFAFNAEQRELNLVAVSLSVSATPVLQEFFDRNPEYLHICNGHAAQNNEVLQWLKSQGTK